jgi:ABC-type antimicrobial peptide transport system permease subunit
VALGVAAAAVMVLCMASMMIPARRAGSADAAIALREE